MHPADIKAAIEKAGTTQSAIAASVHGRTGKPITVGAVHLVLRGVTKSARIARRISEVTGIPVARLWPGKYPLLEKMDRIAGGNPAVAAILNGAGAAQVARDIKSLRGPGAVHAPRRKSPARAA